MTIKVSPNDPKLAHQLARQGIAMSAERLLSGRGHKLIEAGTVKQFVRGVLSLFPGQVIDSAIDRVIGGRARAAVVVADMTNDGNVGLAQLIFSAKLPHGRRVTPHRVPIILQKHAVGRIMQRITGTGDLPAAISVIQPHLHATLLWVVANYPLTPGLEVQASGRGLEVSGSVDQHGTLRLKTAITAASMTSAMRRGWAMSEQVIVRCRLTSTP